MKYLVLGAGAIGTYIGGSLLESGCDVAFLEKPQFAGALKENGIRLNIARKISELNDINLFTSPVDAFTTNYDVVIFAMKSFDTASAALDIAPFRSQINTILCLQNGVENEAVIAHYFGEGKVTAGSVTSAVGRLGVGDIVLEKMRGIGIASQGAISRGIYSDMHRAGLNPQLIRDGDSMKWSKMLSNLLANASCAILDMTPTEVFEHTGLYRMELNQIREALAVMRELGFRAVDLPGVPMGLLAGVIDKVSDKLSKPVLEKAVGGGRGGKMPSLHIDLHAGRKQSEVVFLNGAVSKFGVIAGIKTPVNTCLNKLLLEQLDTPSLMDEFKRQPEKLLTYIASAGAV